MKLFAFYAFLSIIAIWIALATTDSSSPSSAMKRSELLEKRLFLHRHRPKHYYYRRPYPCPPRYPPRYPPPGNPYPPQPYPGPAPTSAPQVMKQNVYQEVIVDAADLGQSGEEESPPVKEQEQTASTPWTSGQKSLAMANTKPKR